MRKEYLVEQVTQGREMPDEITVYQVYGEQFDSYAEAEVYSSVLFLFGANAVEASLEEKLNALAEVIRAAYNA